MQEGVGHNVGHFIFGIRALIIFNSCWENSSGLNFGNGRIIITVIRRVVVVGVGVVEVVVVVGFRGRSWTEESFGRNWRNAQFDFG